jgi:pyruvate formate lyase activating enzyme
MIVHILGTTLVDYPGKVAATLFSAGCNLRCPFCHNPELVIPEQYKNIEQWKTEDIINYLKKRKKLISGVVFTGGEPLMHNEINHLAKEIKKLDLSIKLDTNGCFPEKLSGLLDIFDYFAMDIKTGPENYLKATGNRSDFTPIRESIKILMNSHKEYEFRTTMVPTLVSPQDIFDIVKEIKGASLYALQKFQSAKTLDSEMQGLSSMTSEDIENIAQKISGDVKKLVIR